MNAPGSGSFGEKGRTLVMKVLVVVMGVMSMAECGPFPEGIT